MSRSSLRPQQLATVDQSVQSQARTIQDLPDAKLGVVNNALQNGKTQMAALAQVTENLSGMLNMLPNFLGANGARNYVLLAQTNSEIRGTGGLIGSAGPQRGQRQDRGGGVPRGCRVPLQRRVG